MRFYKATVIIVMLTVLFQFSSCSKDGNSSNSTPTSRNKIAYLLFIDNEHHICVVNSDGSSCDTLTDSSDYNHSWSPDGTKILFSRYYNGMRWEIYTMNADGSEQTKLTQNSVGEFNAQWSPDGSKILFNATLISNSEIYIINADGTNMVNLTNNSAGDYSPSWSSDGTQIAFHSRRGTDTHYGIYVMDVDGGNQTKINVDPFNHQYPVWSPDGSRIICEYSNVSGEYLKTMSPSGGYNRNLISPPNNMPLTYSWSPDGSQIAYSANAASGGREIFLVDTAGTAIVNISNSEGDDEGPSWSPDGTKIIFGSDRSDDNGIYMMNPDGSSQVKIIGHTTSCSYPAWSPASE